jgi:hypothetical protein
LSELLSGDPERKYGDCACDHNRRDELLVSGKAARAQGISIATASVEHRDRLGRRHGAVVASSFRANLETLLRNYRWIFCPILKSGMDPLL